VPSRPTKKVFLFSLLSYLAVLVIISCAGRSDTVEVADQAPEHIEQTTEHIQTSDDLYAIDAAQTIYAMEAIRALYVIDTAQAIYAMDAIHALYAIDTAQALYAIEASAGLYDIAATLAGEAGLEEDVEIPVVEPKKIEPRKAYIEPTIKVQVLGGASSIKIAGKQGLSLSFGNNFLKIAPNAKVMFKPRSARVSLRSYAVGIGTFEGDEYDEALDLAEEWKRKKYTVRLIKAGGPLVQADGTVSDTTIYWVALGKFRDEKTAERFKDKMFSWGLSAWVIDESLLGPRGNIEILDQNGHSQAYADSRVYLSSNSPIEIFNVPFGHGFWSSGNREHRRYTSPIEIIVDKRGRLAAINELKMEEYIKGIVPVEIRLTAHDEALKTQAIAARTESIAKIGIKHVFDPYDFCASQHCQEFGGLTRRTQRTDAAVDTTRGKVVMRKGTLIDAVYSANCGGHTEDNDYVWSSRPNSALRGVSDLYSNPESFDSPVRASQLRNWLTGVPSAYCADPRVGDRRKFRWSVKFTPAKLSKIVNHHRRVGDVKDIKILRRGVSGRAVRIQIIGSRDNAIINKELQIRRVLGGLKSSMFVVDTKRNSSGNPTSFTLQGGGWGHGVGMCQAGAEGMALRGFECPQILGHYFSGVEIKDLYD
jgi:SpoIID/LytB domain protein